MEAPCFRYKTASKQSLTQKQKNPQDNGPGDMELTAGIEPATSTLPM